jgi:hypothetical protein
MGLLTACEQAVSKPTNQQKKLISQLTDYLCKWQKEIGLCYEGTLRFVWTGAECLWMKSLLRDLSIHASFYLVKSTV